MTGDRHIITEEEVIELHRRYFVDGESMEDLATEHGFSRGTLLRRFERFGLETHSYWGHKNKSIESNLKGMVDDFIAGMSINGIRRKYGFASDTIIKHLKKVVPDFDDIHRKNWEANSYTFETLTDDEMKNLYQEYVDGRSTSDIAEEFNTFVTTVGRAFRKRGYKMMPIKDRLRKPCREDAFDDAENCPEAAMWVGFLMGDGTVSRQKGRNARISLGLAGDDDVHVKELAAFVGTETKIRTYQPKNNVIMGRECNLKRMTVCCFTSDRIADALEKYGVVPNKTYSAKVKKLEFNPNFYRGLICADGTIRINKRGLADVKLVGNYDLVAQFAAYVKSVTGRDYAIVNRGTKTFPDFSTISIGGSQAAKIVWHMFRDCTVALPRKWETAKKIMATTTEDGMRIHEDGTIQKEFFDWSVVTAEQLVELFRKHRSWSEVGKSLGTTGSKVSAIAQRRGARVYDILYNYDHITKDLLLEKHRIHGSWRRVREDLGISKPKLLEFVRKHEVKVKRTSRRKFTSITKDMLLESHSRLGDWLMVADEFGLSHGYIYPLANKLGIVTKAHFNLEKITDDELFALYQKHSNWNSVCRTINVSPNTLRVRLKEKFASGQWYYTKDPSDKRFPILHKREN